MTTSGLYQIVNLTTGKRYIGVSKDIDARWQVHRSQLRLNDHHSIYLQRSWNLHGELNFEFRVIKECDRRCAACLETILVPLFGEELYNVAQVPIQNFNSERRVVSNEHRQKLSDSRKKYLARHPETILHFTQNLRFAQTPQAQENRKKTWKQKLLDPDYREDLTRRRQESRKQSGYDASKTSSEIWANRTEEERLEIGKKISEGRRANNRIKSVEERLCEAAKKGSTRRKNGRDPYTGGLFTHSIMLDAMRKVDESLSLEDHSWGQLIYMLREKKNV